MEATDARTAREVRRSPSRVRLRVLVSGNLSRISFGSDFRHDGGQSTCSYASVPRASNGRFCQIQAFTSPNSSTAAAVTFITFVQDLKKKTKAWAPLIELCASGEKTLERFRYQFPDDWLYSDQLRGEWSAYNEILKRKNDSIQEQLGTYPHDIFERCVINQYVDR
jgi:hypothetical protein